MHSHLSRRQLFYPFLGLWSVLGYLSVSNVDMTPQAVVFDCSPGYGDDFSYLPVPQWTIRPLALAQPVLAFPLRNLAKAAAADIDRMAEVRLNWATLSLGILFPFRASNSGNLRADFLFFSCLNVALQVLLLLSTFLVVRHSRRVANPRLQRAVSRPPLSRQPFGHPKIGLWHLADVLDAYSREAGTQAELASAAFAIAPRLASTERSRQAITAAAEQLRLRLKNRAESRTLQSAWYHYPPGVRLDVPLTSKSQGE